jgi:hypothetical protein
MGWRLARGMWLTPLAARALPSAVRVGADVESRPPRSAALEGRRYVEDQLSRPLSPSYARVTARLNDNPMPAPRYQ